MKTDSQKGFGHLVILLLLVVAAVIALAAYKVVKNRDSLDENTPPVASQPVQVIKNKADLDRAKGALNQTDIDGDLNPDDLNQDVDSLL